ncbi:MAG: VOC family protein, partial [Limisphaerales bacterium]
MGKTFDHIDLRVPKLAEVKNFYETLLPALGFSRRVSVEGWLQFETAGDDIAEFFGVTESEHHIPNENRIAFRAESRQAVDRIAAIAQGAGARNL